jgi:hypothetical protein
MQEARARRTPRPVRWFLLGVGAVALHGSPAGAQVRYDAGNVRVEILGLERWTLRMLQDSMARYVPGKQLHDAACMIALRRELKFPEVQVHTSYLAGGPAGQPGRYLSIRVVEPWRRSTVQWKTAQADTFQSLLPVYAPLILSATDSSGRVQTSRLFFEPTQRTGTLAWATALTSDSSRRSDDAVGSASRSSRWTEDDRRRALHHIERSGLHVNRVAAAVVLSGFPDQDSSWYALVGALRDRNESVRMVAAARLMGMPRRSINWAPASNDLRILLGGTSLMHMEELLRVLSQTGLSANLAASVLRDNDAWLFRLLTSEVPTASSAARAFLVSLNGGQDLGSSPAAWRAWLAKQ